MYQIIFNIQVGSRTFIAISFIFISTAGYAQNSKVDKQVDTAVKVVDGIKSIFKKNRVGRENSGNIPAVQGIAGRVTDKTILIDCDFINPFVRDAAIIKKGNAYALINSKGEFVFPFNKFKSMSSFGVGYIVADGKTYNTSGKLLSDKITSTVDDIYNGDYIVLDNASKGKEVIDIDGSKRIITKSGKEILGKVYKNVAAVSVVKPNTQSNVKYLYGLKDLNNKPVLPCQFDELFEFYQGYACFGVQDDFGNIKYGVVDDKGTIIIEPKYSNRLVIYGDGYFGVIEHSSQDYKSGILNTKGEFIYKAAKMTKASEPVLAECLSGTCVNYEDGYFFSQDFIVDKKGTISKTLDFLKGKGLRSDVKFAKFLASNSFLAPGINKYAINDGCISFFYTDPDSKERCVGMYFPAKNKILTGGNFQESIIFDPVSKLAFVKQKVKTGSGVVFNKGYINEDGDFVMMMKAAAQE